MPAAERLRLAFADLEPAMQANYMTTAEQLVQQGRAQILLTQLEQRFGPLPAATIERVRTSTRPNSTASRAPC